MSLGSHPGEVSVFRFWAETTRYEVSIDEEVKRLAAYAMVFLMPQKGLDEAVTSLYEMLEFYGEPVASAIPPVTTRWTSGVIVSKRDRPSLSLAD